MIALAFLFGLVVGATAVYFWLDYRFSKDVEEVFNVVAEKREGALDE